MSELEYEKKPDHVALITLNRPEARNAYSDELKRLLLEALDEAETDDSVRTLVLTGAGKAFSAGGDIKAMADRSGMFAGDPPELRTQYRYGLQAVTRRFDSFEKPVIAAINGAAIGAGLGLALNCDIRICSERARLGATFAKVGLIPGDGSGYLLTRIVGFAKALELVLTARVLDAEDAHRIGLVNEVVPRDEVLKRALEVATEIAALPPGCVRLAKSHIYRTAHTDLNTSLHMAAAFQGLTQSTDEHLEAVEAMIEAIHGKD